MFPLYNYSPFNYNTSFNLWTSTTAPASSVTAFICAPTNGDFNRLSKSTTTNMRYIPCRTFTVTGTTLS